MKNILGPLAIKKIAIIGIIILPLIVFTFIMLPGKNKTTKDLKGLEIATFAGGCFWCVEVDFQKVPGVVEVISGYTGGDLANPEYEQVSSGTTGHREAVQVYYDKTRVNYRDLVQYFFQHIDPTDASGSFQDRGAQYASAIYYGNEQEKIIAEEEKKRLADSRVFDGEIVTTIEELGDFYKAEDYHQDYSERNSLRYKFYRKGSGRDRFLEDIWRGDKDRTGDYLEDTGVLDLSHLSPLQYKVTQEEGTEPAFNNEYWDETREGIYVDIVSGQPLFSSTDKYKSGTGWPSFTKPISESSIAKKEDKKLFTTRIEVSSSESGSHLGHVFDDGPAPSGKRYCLNSAALRFIPKKDLAKEALEEYLQLFE